MLIWDNKNIFAIETNTILSDTGMLFALLLPFHPPPHYLALLHTHLDIQVCSMSSCGFWNPQCSRACGTPLSTLLEGYS